MELTLSHRKLRDSCIKEGAQVLQQAIEWVSLPAAERRFLKNSAEGRKLFICRRAVD